MHWSVSGWVIIDDATIGRDNLKKKKEKSIEPWKEIGKNEFVRKADKTEAKCNSETKEPPKKRKKPKTQKNKEKGNKSQRKRNTEKKKKDKK